jgi:hypothetical protein
MARLFRYQECNPSPIPLPASQANAGSFACCDSLDCTGRPGPAGFPPTHKNASDYCYCDRTNRTVGRSSTAAHFGNVPGAKYMPVELQFSIGCWPCPTWGTAAHFCRRVRSCANQQCLWMACPPRPLWMVCPPRPPPWVACCCGQGNVCCWAAPLPLPTD